MKISRTTIIDAPAPFVFQILLNVELATKWVPMLTSYSRIAGAPNKVGSTYCSKYNYDGYVLEIISEIKAITTSQSIRWSYRTKLCDGEEEHFLTSVSDVQTEFKHVSECHYKGLTKILVRLSKSKYRKKSEAFLSETHMNFKSLVESLYSSKFG